MSSEMNGRLARSWASGEMNPRYWPRTQEGSESLQRIEWPIYICPEDHRAWAHGLQFPEARGKEYHHQEESL